MRAPSTCFLLLRGNLLILRGLFIDAITGAPEYIHQGPLAACDARAGGWPPRDAE